MFILNVYVLSRSVSFALQDNQMVLRIRFRSIKEVSSAAEQNLTVDNERSAKLYVNVALNFVNQVKERKEPVFIRAHCVDARASSFFRRARRT